MQIDLNKLSLKKQIEHLKNNPEDISKFKKPSAELVAIAIEAYGYESDELDVAIDMKMKQAIIKYNPNLVCRIGSVSDKMIIEALKDDRTDQNFVINVLASQYAINEKLWEFIIEHCGAYYIYNDVSDTSPPPERILILAIKKDPTAIQFIDKPTLQMQLLAVSLDGKVIKHIYSPSTEVQIAAYKQTPLANRYIKKKSKEYLKFVDAYKKQNKK